MFTVHCTLMSVCIECKYRYVSNVCCRGSTEYIASAAFESTEDVPYNAGESAENETNKNLASCRILREIVAE